MKWEGFSRRTNRWIFFFYSVAVPMGLLIDWSSYFDTPPPVPVVKQVAISDQERDFLLGEYGVVTQEIHARIEHEHLLFVLKFTVVGAVLGLIFRSNRGDEGAESYLMKNPTPGMAIVCWGAVAVSAIIDVRTFFNVNLIREAGVWVRSLEGRMTSGTVPGWEQALAGSGLWSSAAAPFIVLDRQLLTWALYIVTLYIFVPRDLSNNLSRHQELLKIAAHALPICILLFGIVGLNYYFGKDYWLFSHGLLTVVLAVGSVFWLQGWSNGLEPGDHEQKNDAPDDLGASHPSV
jgi:hypothetical protein